jgi:hypothetical protein
MEEYLARLQEDFPLVKVQSFDFASMSYKEQLEIVQDTDILAGVHGAGLTHGMFLPPGSITRGSVTLLLFEVLNTSAAMRLMPLLPRRATGTQRMSLWNLRDSKSSWM